MTIKLNSDLPLKNTEADILRGNKKKEKIKAFIEQVKTDYPTTSDKITQFWTDNKAEYDKLKASSPDTNFLTFWDKFGNETDIIKLVQPTTLEKIDAIFKINKDDHEIIKAIKGVYDKTDIKTYIEDEQGGITYQIFIIDFLREILINYTTNFLNDILASNALTFKDLDTTKTNTIFKKMLDNGCSTFAFTNFEGLSQLVDTENTQLDELRKLVNITRGEAENKKNEQLDEFLKLIGYTSLPVVKAWYNDIIKTWNDNFKDITGEIKSISKANLEAVKDELNTLIKATQDKQAELNKVNQELADLKKATTGGATDAIKALQKEKTDLENELKKITKERDDAIAKGGTGTTGPVPVIAGSDEWKATTLFITETDGGKKFKLFWDLYNNKWTTSQKYAIYNIIKAANNNLEWAETKWGTRF